jgi:alkaline phosphatase
MLAMREWVDEHAEDSPTILISTADHECGGLTVGSIVLDGAPDYWYAPEHFVGAKATPGPLAKLWNAYADSTPRVYLKDSIFAAHGIAVPTDAELTRGLALKNDTVAFAAFLSTAISTRLGVSWSTIGHTAADVTLYGWGKGSEKFAGSRENSEVAHFVAQQLGLDLERTQRLLRRNQTWEQQWVRPQADQEKVARRSLAHHHH